jgi:hypothetical protein
MPFTEKQRRLFLPALLLLASCVTIPPVVHALDLRGDGGLIQRSARARINGVRMKADFGQCRDSEATKRLLEELKRAEAECEFHPE